MTRALSILLFVAAIAFVVSPFTTPEFGGFEADQFPVPQDNPPVQPAGYAFAIWSVIYLGLLVSAGFQLLMRHDDPEWAPLRLPLWISLTVGAAWLPVAQESVVWATVLIWIMWAGAVVALLRAPEFDWWFGEGPIGLYAGWLTAASCVSLGLMAAGYGLLPQLPAALIAFAIALGLAAWVLHARPGAWSFAIAVIWAFTGIVVRNWPDVPVAAYAGAFAILAVCVIVFLQRNKLSEPV